jgi:hypothetical protein
VVDGTVTAEQFRAFMHQDQSHVASFLYGCSQCRWADPPPDLALADCRDDDILHHVLEVDSDAFFEVVSLMIFLMSTQMSTLKLTPHEPCWLLSGVSRCGLDHLTVTVTALAGTWVLADSNVPSESLPSLLLVKLLVLTCSAASRLTWGSRGVLLCRALAAACAAAAGGQWHQLQRQTRQPVGY